MDVQGHRRVRTSQQLAWQDQIGSAFILRHGICVPQRMIKQVRHSGFYASPGEWRPQRMGD